MFSASEWRKEAVHGLKENLREELEGLNLMRAQKTAVNKFHGAYYLHPSDLEVVWIVSFPFVYEGIALSKLWVENN